MAGARPAAVLFDMDGTLIDSEKIWDVALHELAAQAGGRLSPAARAAMVGSSTEESMRILYADLAQPDRDAVADAAWLEHRVYELFSSGLVWRPGARDLLTEVRAAGVPTALVTSTGRRLVDVALATIGRANFDVVVCGDEVERAKPHPTPYRTAADLLGVPIGACVAIEDSPTGVASAHAAGAVVLAVPSEVAVEPVDGIHLRDSLLGVDLPFLSSLLAGAPA